MAKKKMGLVKEITDMIRKEWRPLRDTRVEEDIKENFAKDQKRNKGQSVTWAVGTNAPAHATCALGTR
jgi:hypothetical protein